MRSRKTHNLTNESAFSKTMENIRNHKDIKLVASLQKYAKYVMKPNFKDEYHFTFKDELVDVELQKIEIKIKGVMYLGQVVLDISNTLMHEFYYSYTQPKYGSKIKLCFMNTYSFVCDIKTKHFYKDISTAKIQRSV